ncbi:MAG TPA: anti-sigma factor [Phycisphaerales bacterium]|nr:anti-sigma factor [Phycisphaerales bacterium]
MTTLTPSQFERLQDLLADRALDALDASDFPELDAALPGHNARESSLDVAAGLAATAMLTTRDMDGVPAALEQRLLLSGKAWCESVNAETPAPIPFRGGPGLRALPWLAAAAGIILAIIAWLPGSSSVDPRTGRQRLLATSTDAVTLSWKDWDAPEVPGVQGDVVWSDSAQKGYMRFTNLPTKDSGKEQYQLWIVDSRGMEQRISGGLFNGGTGEVVVPIEPGIRVQNAAAFAVTIEKPGGTWVSDMSRRVVIAAK